MAGLAVVPAIAQDTYREDELLRLRAAKSLRLQPESVPRLEALLGAIRRNRVPERFNLGVNGFRPVIGSLGPGSGLGLGVEFRNPHLELRPYNLRVAASYSGAGFRMLDGEYSIRPAMKNTELGVRTFYRQSPLFDFFGVGPNSSQNDRRGFSLRESSVQAHVKQTLSPRWAISQSARFWRVRPGDPLGTVIPSYFSSYPADSALLQPATFWGLSTMLALQPPPDSAESSGLSLQLRQDFLSEQRMGGTFYLTDFQAGYNQAFQLGSRGLSLRFRTTAVNASSDAAVPLYLKPQLGGPFDLRGFRGRRFYGDNLVFGSAEYRWQILSGMDMATFVDSGKVLDQWSRLHRGRLETSYGVGLRSRGKGALTSGLRVDLAWSREGGQIWLIFQPNPQSAF